MLSPTEAEDPVNSSRAGSSLGQPHSHPSDNPWYALIRNAVRALEHGQTDQARRASIMVLAFAPVKGGPTVRAARACARALRDCLDSKSGFGPEVAPNVVAQAIADAVKLPGAAVGPVGCARSSELASAVSRAVSPSLAKA